MAISTEGVIKGWHLEGAVIPTAANIADNVATAASAYAYAAAAAVGSSSVPGSAAAAPRWANFLLNIYFYKNL